VPDRAKRSRTIIITGRPERGHGVPASEREHRFFREAAAVAPASRGSRSAARRPRRGAVERAGHRPDRIALWAFVLGVLVVLIAATSSNAATVGKGPWGWAAREQGSSGCRSSSGGSAISRLQPTRSTAS
jgi:hypothetical protein